MRINYAVIGCGVISSTHTWAIKNHPSAELTHVCDTNKSRADAAGTALKAEAVYDIKELLENPGIQAISIALPHYLHHEVFKSCLESEKHVICEKPLGINPAELESMILLASKSKLKTAGIFQHRFSPLARKLRPLIQQGSLGKIVSADVDFECERTPAYYAKEVWRGRWSTAGGGLLLNQAIHTLDLAVFLFGKPLVVDGSIHRERMRNIEVEDHAEGFWLTDTGINVNMKAANSRNGGWAPEISIVSEEGTIQLDGSDKIRSIKLKNKQLEKEILESTENTHRQLSAPGKECYGDLHAAAFYDFTEAVLKDRKPYVSIKDASAANELVLAFYNATAVGKEQTLPLSEYKIPELILQSK